VEEHGTISMLISTTRNSHLATPNDLLYTACLHVDRDDLPSSVFAARHPARHSFPAGDHFVQLVATALFADKPLKVEVLALWDAKARHISAMATPAQTLNP